MIPFSVSVFANTRINTGITNQYMDVQLSRIVRAWPTKNNAPTNSINAASIAVSVTVFCLSNHCPNAVPHDEAYTLYNNMPITKSINRVSGEA